MKKIISRKIHSNRNNRISVALADIIEGFQNYYLWFALAIKDARLRYKRTVLGPIWQSLSLAIFIGTLGVLYSKFWNLEVKEFLPFLSVGLVSWTLISAVIIEGCNAFISNEQYLNQKGMPFSSFIYLVIARNIIVFLHNLPIVIIVFMIFDPSIKISMFYIIPGFIILIINLTWICFLLSIICTRFRDISTLVVSLVQIAFFLTPVFWVPDLVAGSKRAFVVDANPIYHFIELLRGPLLGYVPADLTWVVTVSLAIIGCSFTLIIFSKSRARINYWL